ncbi:sulfotransferase family protein [Steroidobacter agaridevorans]|uniref:sulfotransferase family protein n=1 Tax=Steroidobacter agaridevorans TaxID=2695856 RepID=UPI0013276071|nr:sulfotransferase [Steroidobacter agaridevorans]GFE90661.1 putative sulfotransferase [Steroidobacter agaridevorans]
MGDYEELLDAARAETDLEDFGADDFLEGLQILVRALRTEAQLNALGEAVLRQRIVGHLKQRLQVEDWYRRHPEIETVVIRAPLIGLGLPRTGSSALSCLLAEDPNSRSLLTWEASEPCPPPATVVGPDPRIERARELSRRSNLKSHTPTSATGPIECQDLMALDFKAHIFQAFAQIPSYSQWLLAADLTSTYLYERRVLKLLQWKFPEKPWRLKAPTHILYLDALVRAFPDARFVMTHRDPAEVVLSVANVYADIVGKFTDALDKPYLGQLNVKQWSVGMKRALAFRESGADSKFFDIDFRVMQRDPLGEVRALYEWLGAPVTDEFESGMTRWWKHNAETREPSTSVDPAGFGLSVEHIRPLFAEYTARAARWTSKESTRHVH